jgi:O-antigen/teichoic acid export membrane protein
MSVPADSAQPSQSFRRGFAATFVVDLMTKVLAAITVVVLIRGLSVSSYAYTTLFLTLAQFAGSAAGSGVRTFYLREEAERLSRGSRGRAEGREASFVIALLKGTLLIVGIGICAVPIMRAGGLESKFGGDPNLVVYAIVFAAGFSATELAIVRYQAKRRFFAAGALSLVRAAALLAASLIILATSKSNLSISVWFAASMLIVGITTAGIVGSRSLRHGPFPHITMLGREETLLTCYYVAAAGFAYVDVIVASALLSKSEVATLGAALRYLAIVLGPIPALGAVLRVRTSQVDLVDSLANQRAMLLSWIRRTALPAAVLVGLAMALAPVLIPQIDGGRYPDSVVVFQIFLATALTAYVTAPGVSILMTQRRYLALASIYAVGLLLNFVGDVVVARPFGVIGIAVVSSSIYVFLDILMTSYALRRASTYGARLTAPSGSTIR